MKKGFSCRYIHKCKTCLLLYEYYGRVMQTKKRTQGRGDMGVAFYFKEGNKE